MSPAGEGKHVDLTGIAQRITDPFLIGTLTCHCAAPLMSKILPRQPCSSVALDPSIILYVEALEQHESLGDIIYF